MIQIPLQRARGFCLIDDADLPLVQGFKWYLKAGQRTSYADTIFFMDGQRIHITMHRMLLGLPACSSGIVDHVNRDGLDNRRANLRVVSSAQNAQNAKPRLRTECGYRGVETNGTRFRAKIQAFRTKHDLGTYATAQEAARVYDRAAVRLHGQFASLNFPSEGKGS